MSVDGYPAYRVILNPGPTDLGIAPGYLVSAYRADAPTTTVLSRSPRRPTRQGRFRVPPSTPSGLYMVLIFDGAEAGSHNSWEYVHVVDAEDPEPTSVVAGTGREAALPQRAPGAVDGSSAEPVTDWTLTVAIGAAAFVLGAALAAWAARRRNA